MLQTLLNKITSCKQHGILNCISYATLLLGFIIIGTTVFWLTYPYKTVQIKTQPFKILTPVVKQGDTLQYEVDYCKISSEEILISRKFIDGIVFSVPDITSKNPVGCRKSVIGIEVPHGLPSGNYYLQMEWYYKVNPIRTIGISSITEQFKVIN